MAKRIKRSKNHKMKSVEIALSQWVKFNEENAQETLNKNRAEDAAAAEGTGNSGSSDTLQGLERVNRRGQVIPSAQTQAQSSQELPDASQAAAAQPVSKRQQVPRQPKARTKPPIQGDLASKDSVWETKKEYALARRKKILETAEQLEQLKKEYRVLAEYYNEISLLEDLPDNGTGKLKETAEMIQKLQDDRKSFQEDMTRLDDGIYMQMSRYTEDMPDVIRKLTADELYVSKLKSEIDRLEGEKGEQQFEGKAVERSQGKMKTLSIVSMFSLLVLFAVLFVLQVKFEADTQVATLLCGIAFAGVTMGVFINYFNNVNLAKRTEYQLNKIIKEQNQTKLKYVNAKNGVDYVYRKYNVHSASELLFQWEQFMVAKNAKDNYQRAGNEIMYYTEHLQKQLEQYPVQDVDMWLGQIECFADTEKMDLLKQQLKGKIQEARKKIDGCRNLIQKTRDEISLLAIRNPEYADQIRELTELSGEVKGVV